ncbi:M56 family metallopeptidase [uncultured Maribacter sp.]|uniref:M56 family metallopeptidase n=1 Tax=uncultured Maribacter sp. TaxID=431308 RepID=UPI0026057454|nr:M56 family metallopeptidase [uncultured Maribacter sp.]
MSIFLLFYKLLLEKESMHHFKRYFLLTAVIASFIIPQIVFTEYIEVEPTTAVTQIISINEPQDIQPVVKAVETSPMNWYLILWTIYGLGVAGFSLRFLINLYKIWKRIHNNPKTKHSTIYRILLKEQLPPHTFLKYIFLNKRKFEVNSIPDSVIKHEETHAIQRHSLDVLFLEVLQVVFWFNPLIYVYKKTIKLNHEFLADSAVLNGQEDHLNYQNTLLSYLSNDSFKTYQSVGIANAINYSSIKKRFIIMKKQTSKKGIVLRSLLLLPVLALMLYGFSQKNVIAQNTIKDINIEITKSGSLLMNNEPVALEKLSEKALNVNQNIDTYIFKNYITANILYDENQYKLIDQVQSELQSVGIFNIEHFSKRTTGIFNQNGFASSDYDGKTIDEAKKIRRNNVLNTHKTDANNEPLLEIAWIEIKNENEIWFNDQLVPLSKLNEKVKAEFPLAIKNNKLSAQVYTTEHIDSDFTDAITVELRKLNTKSITIFSDRYAMPEDDSSNKLRSDNTSNKNPNRIIELAGLVIDSETLEPLVNAEIKDHNGTVLTKTDIKGYYSFELNNSSPDEINFNLTVKKDGYKSLLQKEHWGNFQSKITSSFFFGLQKNYGATPEFSKLFTSNGNLDYTSVSKNKSIIESERFFNSKLEDAKNGNTNCIVEVNETPYLVDATSWIKLNSTNDIIAINDKENLPAYKLNGYINRNSIKAMSPLESYDTAQFAVYTTSGDINANLSKRAFSTYNKLAKKYNAIHVKKREIPLNDLKILESVYRNLSPAQREEAQPFPKSLPKQNQDGATKEQISTYNKLAKSYNTMISKGGNIRIMKADLDNLNYIYGLMSAKQKTAAEPFPDFPEPPPVPKAPKAPNTAAYADAEIERIIATQDTYDGELLQHKANNLPHNNTAYINTDEELKYDEKKPENTRVYIYNSNSAKTKNNPSLMEYLRSLEKQNAQFYFEGEKISSEEGFVIIKNEKDIKIQTLPYANRPPEIKIYKKTNTDLIPPPPSPPTPPSPLDYAINMAKKGATFFYEGKEVSSDKAIDLLKKKKELNIESREKNGKAEVRITKEPVTIR